MNKHAHIRKGWLWMFGSEGKSISRYYRLGLCSLLIAAILLVAGVTRAQQSGQVFAHADAVNKYVHKRYKLFPDGSLVLQVEVQTEVMSYKGKKDRSDFRIPYNSAFQTVTVNKAVTVLRSGKVLSVDPREIQDILDPRTADSSIFSKARLKIINFPGVEVGSKIEIRYTVKNNLGLWAKESFRLSDPTLEKQVELEIPAQAGAGSLTMHFEDPLIHHTKRTNGGRVTYSWSAKNLPKQYSEPQAPALENQPFCLLVSGFRSWSEVANFFVSRFGLSRLNGDFAVPSWAREKDPDTLYRNLLENIAVYDIDLFDTDLIPRLPRVTLQKGYGSSLDLAVLFHFLLKRQGLDPTLVLANTNGVFIKALRNSFYPALFNQVLVHCKGKFYCFVDKDMPPGVNRAQGGLGLDLSHGRLVEISSDSPNRRSTHLGLTLTPEGRLLGKCGLAFQGLFTVDIRSKLRNTTGRELEIKISQILHDIDPIAGLEGAFVTKGISQLRKVIQINFPFSINTPLAYSGGAYFLPLPDSELIKTMSTYVPIRHYGLAIPATKSESITLKLVLPPGLTVVSMPRPSKGHVGPLSWEIKSKADASHYEFHRTLTLHRQLVRAKDVPALLDRICELTGIGNRLLALKGR